ncbi:MAG TPA: hypothetical protein DIW64_02980 [Cellvibrio sp.]|nr:hypothetical protein [Cellvibrio sp.]
MKRNIKHYSDRAAHAANKPHREAGNEVTREEYLLNSEKDLDGESKSRKRYDRNEQKRLYLHRLH